MLIRCLKISSPLLIFHAYASAAIEFTGVLTSGESKKFALADTVNGSSAWVSVGQRFEGYTVERYEASTESVVLTKESERLSIRINDPRIKKVEYDIEGTITIGPSSSIVVVQAALHFDQETEFPLGNGLTLRIKPQLQADGTIKYRTSFEKNLSNGKHEILANPSIISAPGKAFSIRLGDLGFDFKPKTA